MWDYTCSRSLKSSSITPTQNTIAYQTLIQTTLCPRHTVKKFVLGTSATFLYKFPAHNGAEFHSVQAYFDAVDHDILLERMTYQTRPAHPSGARQACVRRRSASCLEQSPWWRSERANTGRVQTVLENSPVHTVVLFVGYSVSWAIRMTFPFFSVRRPCNVYWLVTAPYKSPYYYYYYYYYYYRLETWFTTRD